MKLTNILSCLSLSALIALPVAHANATSTPSSADAGRVEKNLQQDLPDFKRSAPIDVKGNAPFEAPAGSQKITFILKDVVLEDASVYPTSEIKYLYDKKIGTKISLADVYSIAANLTAKYRADGYILTQVVVPPQTIGDGTVRLRVVEGRLNDIRVDGTGALGSNADIINQYVAQLKSKGVLKNANLEKTLLLINDLPGVTARSVLSPSKSVVGASDLTILVERKKIDGSVQVDNFGSRYLGMWEVLGGFNLNSIFGQNERITAQMAYAPSNQGVEPELLYGSLSAALPVGAYGTTLEANIGKSYTNPGAGLENFDVLGKSYSNGIKVNQPFIRTRELNLSSSLGLDRRSTETKSNIDTFKNDDITSLRLGGHVDYVDTLFSAAITNANIELSRGLSILGASKKGDSDLSRIAGNPEYTKITADISRLERLTNDFSLMVATKGQLSSSALLSAEEFGIGGANAIGRGYDPSELVGEDGVAGSVELRWASPYKVSWLDNYSVYGFYDIGKVWNDDATTSSQKEQSLASTGLGMRANINSATRAGFMVALPLTREVAAEGNDDPRFYFNLSRDF
ncbi:MAG TPA: ShlB/FhaC/HecB family hemolysin secretion/activation protein [Rhodospirillaceae bacterium]|nr:ShlB/FhaC/HecB family hemolysin secretion/activation protein [Rhodospirillaceae bacterium]